VLIIGCGPTGLTLAAQLAAFADVSVCIVDQRDGPLQVGQADGIACRTMEMFAAFGFAERVEKEAYWVNETVFWKPDPSTPRRILRSGRIQDVEDGLSEFPHVILNQARVHDLYLDVMRHSPGALTPDYGRRLDDLRLPTSDGEPVVARFEGLEAGDGGGAGEMETVRARYVVGCDGARSAVRRFMGGALRGDSANQSWGVMDVLAVTDFPDIRFKAVVHSADEGNLLVIPREGGYMVRLYIELDELRVDERVASREVTIERLIDAARRILAPYTLDVEEVVWWSVYEIGQRLCAKYDDVADDDTVVRLPRVFIAGDACHTHSPKAGLGMNVSMSDAFNLGWKLASVVRGQCRPQILPTYSSERRAVAKELIDFDREFAAMFSARPQSSDDEDGVDPAEFQRYFQQHGRFTAGTATRYGPSVLVGAGTNQHLATGFEIGMRFHSAPVVRLADAKPMHLGHVAKADGRWRLFAFADEVAPNAPGSRLAELCALLAADPRSPLLRYRSDDVDIDAVVDLRAVVQQGHQRLVIGEMPSILRPHKGRFGLVDYEKVFGPDRKAGQDIFEMRGVDRTVGALVVVRPDQHVGHVLPLDGFDELVDFFAGFMVPAGRYVAGA